MSITPLGPTIASSFAAPRQRSKRRWLWLAVAVLLLSGAVGATLVARAGWFTPTPPEGETHWRLAQEALLSYDFTTAREHLARCVELWPLNAEARFAMARTCRRGGDLAAWERHLDAAVTLGWPVRDLELETHLRQAQGGDVEAVEEALRRYLATFPPEEVLIYEALALGCLEDKRQVDLIVLTEAWQRRFPDDWRARLYHGRALQFSERRQEAIADFHAVLDQKPDQPLALLWLAQNYLVNNQFAEALDCFRAYAKRFPDDPDVLFGLAHGYFGISDAEQARTAVDRLLAQKPKHAAGLLLRAQMELAAGSPEQALESLRRAEKLSPHETDIVYAFVRTLRQLNRPQEADRYQARLDGLNKKYERIDELTKKLRQRAADSDARYELGILSLELGREGDAGRWFSSVLLRDPRHAATHRALADYYQKKGDAPRADHHRRLGAGG